MEESFKYHIPEDIPANERTAFHGAAAAAAKAGKKNFNFGGKTHPVTMKKDTAKAIADQKESTMSFREKLMSLYESDRAKHYKGAAEAEPMDNNLKGAGAKKMKADIQGNVADKDLEKQSHDDAAKAGRAGPGTKYRSNDNKKGDKKIINPPSDETKKGKAPKVAVESYGVSGNKISGSLLDAVNQVMNEDVSYHKAMKNAHNTHSYAHENEVTNDGHEDHDYAGTEHAEAANHHQKAIDAYKKHGGDSSEYKKAADAAHKQTAMAHEASKDAGKFKQTAKPGIKFPKKPN